MAAFAMAMLVCSDLARSRTFYRDVLNLRIGTDASPDWVDFDLGDGQRLGLHPDSETLMVRAGSLQLGFNVDTYLHNTLDFMRATDVTSGLAKAAVFGFLSLASHRSSLSPLTFSVFAIG